MSDPVIDVTSFISSILTLVVDIAKETSKEQQESILKEIEAAHVKILGLPSLAVDISKAADARKEQLGG